MKVIDAFWEKRNLNKSVCEISFTDDDIDNLDNIENELKNFTTCNEYIVVKVPTHLNKIMEIINRFNFKFVETQIQTSVNNNLFNVENYNILNKEGKFKLVKSSDSEDYKLVANEILKGLFTTDRISLDSRFGVSVANKRYANWLQDMSNDSKYILYLVYYDNKPMGFHAGHVVSDEYKGDLGGIFTDFQNNIYGIYWAFTFIKSEINKYKKITSFCSTNNLPIIRLWEYFGSRIDSATHVYTN